MSPQHSRPTGTAVGLPGTRASQKTVVGRAAIGLVAESAPSLVFEIAASSGLSVCFLQVRIQ